MECQAGESLGILEEGPHGPSSTYFSVRREKHHFPVGDLMRDPVAPGGGSSWLESSPGLQIPGGGVTHRKRVTLVVGTFPGELEKSVSNPAVLFSIFMLLIFIDLLLHQPVMISSQWKHFLDDGSVSVLATPLLRQSFIHSFTGRHSCTFDGPCQCQPSFCCISLICVHILAFHETKSFFLLSQ